MKSHGFVRPEPCEQGESAHGEDRNQCCGRCDARHLPLGAGRVGDYRLSRVGQQKQETPQRGNCVERDGFPPVTYWLRVDRTRSSPQKQREQLINQPDRKKPTREVRKRHAKVRTAIEPLPGMHNGCPRQAPWINPKTPSQSSPRKELPICARPRSQLRESMRDSPSPHRQGSRSRGRYLLPAIPLKKAAVDRSHGRTVRQAKRTRSSASNRT